MAMDSREPVRWHQTLSYVVAWLISAALLMIDLLLVRGLIINGLTSIGALRRAMDPDRWPLLRLTYGWTANTVDLATLLIICCVCIALAILIETYYRKGLPEGLLRRRVIRVVGIQVGVGAAALLISWVLVWLIGRTGT